MRNRYFTFLYNECKRLSTQPVDINEIESFINSPEGQRGLAAFNARHKEKQVTRPKALGEVLGAMR